VRVRPNILPSLTNREGDRINDNGANRAHIVTNTLNKHGHITKIHLKVALFTISYQGFWYADDYLPLEKIISKVTDYGYDGISLSANRPHLSPLDYDDRRCKAIREQADSSGLELVAVETYSNFMDPVIESREAQLIWLRELIHLSNTLGIKIVKIFPGWHGITLRNGKGTYDRLYNLLLPYASSDERWKWIKDNIIESLKWAKEYGVTLALQNHGPPFRPGYEDCLAMIREIDSDNLKMCLDIGVGCFDKSQQTNEYIREAVQACRDLVIYSHFNGNFKGAANGLVMQVPYNVDEGPAAGVLMNYETFVKELKQIGYSGYHSYEVCGPVRIKHELQGIGEVDRLVQCDLVYMRRLITLL
jgi:sugar phosphate isomerase/epimerase